MGQRKIVSTKLEEIYNHFGKKVNIVAHSKGGIDTQAALVGYGANRFVGNVITLATPHHGSNLADLSYSWWAGWLASILGQKMMVRTHYKWAKWQNFVQRLIIIQQLN